MHCIINQLVVKISGVGIISFFSCLFKNKLFASLRGIFVSHHVVQNGEEKWQKVKFCTSRLHSFDSICLDDDMPTRE